MIRVLHILIKEKKEKDEEKLISDRYFVSEDFIEFSRLKRHIYFKGEKKKKESDRKVIQRTKSKWRHNTEKKP